MNTDILQYETEISILRLIQRLKHYSKQITDDEMACDLEVAANVLNEFLSRSDDFK